MTCALDPIGVHVIQSSFGAGNLLDLLGVRHPDRKSRDTSARPRVVAAHRGPERAVSRQAGRAATRPAAADGT